MRYLVIICLCWSYLAGASVAIHTFKVLGAPAWDPESIKTGIAGSEEAVIYMADELVKLGHQVWVFGDPPKGSRHQAPSANPRYVPIGTAASGKFDAAISWRQPYMANALKQTASKVYLWPHDTFHGPISKEEVEAFDGIFWLSEWQRAQWAESQKAFEGFTPIFGNGLILEQFERGKARENPHALIYGSNYARGLVHLLDIWPLIKYKYPKATLDIYYGWQHWGLLTQAQERDLRTKVSALKYLGVTDHGKVGHKELAEAFERASIWAYPCTAPETFCITALKAQLAGAIPVVLEGSALKETVRHGYKTDRLADYRELLMKAMKEAEETGVEERKKMGDFIVEEFTWKAIAEKWHRFFLAQ